MSGGVAKVAYVAVAILDALAIVVLYGSFLLGISLRSVPFFTEMYPFVALLLFAITVVMIMMLAIAAIKRKVFGSVYMRIPIVVMLVYVVIAALAFGGLLLGI